MGQTGCKFAAMDLLLVVTVDSSPNQALKQTGLTVFREPL
jgi:hypothetical protein